MNEIQALVIEIVVIALVVLFFIALFASYLYKKINHLPTGECAYCRMNTKKMLNQYHKKYSNK